MSRAVQALHSPRYRATASVRRHGWSVPMNAAAPARSAQEAASMTATVNADAAQSRRHRFVLKP